MPRVRRRPTYYCVSSLRDGTIVPAYPIRKPTRQSLKWTGGKIDADNVGQEFSSAGEHIRDVRNDDRIRFQNILSTALNTRRIIREMLLPRMDVLECDLQSIRVQLNHIEQALGAGRPSGD